MVVLGVVVLAVVVSIMVVNWAKLIYKKCYSDRMVLSVLITFNVIGVIFVAILSYLRAKHSGFGNRKNRRKLTFLKIKLFSMYIFGICYLFHCGLYLWKHFSFLSIDECYVNSVLGLLYNFITMMYTLLLFIYFANFYDRTVENTFAENFMSLGILVSNACIWLDTIFSESNFLFKSENDHDPLQILNVTQPTFEAIEIIEKADPFLIPAMIEFSLMAIDLLFTKRNPSANHLKSSYLAADDLLPNRTQNTNNTPPIVGVKSNKNDNISSKLPTNYCNKQRLLQKCETPIRIVCLFIFFIFAFSLFAFTLTVVMINNKSEELLGHPEDFTVYATMQLIMKSTMLLLISICILVEWPCFTFHLNVSAFVLVFTCFGNVVYHVMYCFALDSEGHKNQSHTIHISWAENIISIVLAGFQTLFILGTHSPKNYQSRRRYCMNFCETLHKRFVFYFCSLLGVLNLGLWISDSIGEERLPVFSIAIYKAYDADVWSVINKIILPLTIFFRFHTGVDFLEYFWHQKKYRI